MVWQAKRVLSGAKVNTELPSTCPCLTNYGHYRETTACNKLSLHRGASGMMSGGSGKGFCFPRKPLIRKNKCIRRTRTQVRIELHSNRVDGLARLAWCEGG